MDWHDFNTSIEDLTPKKVLVQSKNEYDQLISHIMDSLKYEYHIAHLDSIPTLDNLNSEFSESFKYSLHSRKRQLVKSIENRTSLSQTKNNNYINVNQNNTKQKFQFLQESNTKYYANKASLCKITIENKKYTYIYTYKQTKTPNKKLFDYGPTKKIVTMNHLKSESVKNLLESVKNSKNTTFIKNEEATVINEPYLNSETLKDKIKKTIRYQMKMNTKLGNKLANTGFCESPEMSFIIDENISDKEKYDL